MYINIKKENTFPDTKSKLLAQYFLGVIKVSTYQHNTIQKHGSRLKFLKFLEIPAIFKNA